MTTPSNSLSPGRELDALVAEKVMGWKIAATRPDGQTLWLVGLDTYELRLPPYSTSIAAAWEVVEKLRKLDWDFILDDMCSGKTWQAHFEKDREVHNVTNIPTAPHALCLAALKAVSDAATS